MEAGHFMSTFLKDGESDNEQGTNLKSEDTDHQQLFDPKSGSRGRLVKGQTSVNIYVCSFCGYQTPFRYILKRHYIGCQLKTGPTDKWKCLKCKQVFRHHSHLRQHKLKVHQPKRLTCNNCFYETTNEAKYDAHFVSGKCPLKKMLKCDRCSFVSSKKQEIINHARTHNPNRQGFVKRAYLCTQCNRRIGSQKLFKRHLMLHATVTKHYCCEYCDFSTPDPGELEGHKSFHRNLQEMVLVQCSRCDFKAFNLKELKEHLGKNNCMQKDQVMDVSAESNGEKSGKGTSDDASSFTCHLCPFLTRYLHILHRHCRTVHRFDVYKKKVLSALDENKGYTCTRCNFVTKYFSNLSRHIKLIHCLGNRGLPSLKMNPLTQESYLNKKGSKFACDVCKIVIVDEYQLAYHKFVEHRDKTELFKWEFICNECNYTSVSKKLSFKHGKAHVQQPQRPTVMFKQYYKGEYKSTFVIDYIKNKILIKNKTSVNKKLSDEKTDEMMDWECAEDDSDGENLEISNKLDVLSYLEDRCVDNPATENILNILEWEVSDDEELVANDEKRQDDGDEIIIIEIVPDTDGACPKCHDTNCQCDEPTWEDKNESSVFTDDSDREPNYTPHKKTVIEHHCNVCGDILPKNQLNAHTNDHAVSMNKPHLQVAYDEFRHDNFVCTYKIKANPGSNQKFYKLGEPTYKCQTCGVLLYIKKSLQNHANLHAKEEDSPSLDIEFTEYRNDSVSAILVLRARGYPEHSPRQQCSSPEMDFDPELPVFDCDECNFKTNDEAARAKHKNLHWNDAKDLAYHFNQWFSCTLCSFHSFDIETLKKHAVKHGHS